MVSGDTRLKQIQTAISIVSSHQQYPFAIFQRHQLLCPASDSLFLCPRLRDVLSTWSSGTGAATFVGPLLYSAMVAAGFSPRKVLLSMIVVPVMMGVRSVTGGTGNVRST